MTRGNQRETDRARAQARQAAHAKHATQSAGDLLKKKESDAAALKAKQAAADAKKLADEQQRIAAEKAKIEAEKAAKEAKRKQREAEEKAALEKQRQAAGVAA